MQILTEGHEREWTEAQLPSLQEVEQVPSSLAIFTIDF